MVLPSKSQVCRIGTRGSALAMAQSLWVKKSLEKLFPKDRFQIVVVKTLGDRDQRAGLLSGQSIGIFTKSIEEKLLSGKIDIAVHSLKDLPTTMPEGLMLAAYPKREAVWDVLISKKKWTLAKLPIGAKVGTMSLRRICQIKNYRGDLSLCPVRGNLETRIREVTEKKKLDALVLASAGIRRLKRYEHLATKISSSIVLPAVGQGALAIEIRRSDVSLAKKLKTLNHKPTELCVLAERAFLKTLRGGCRVPAGVTTRLSGKKLWMKAAVFSVTSTHKVQESYSGDSSTPEKVGVALARLLLKKGADKLLLEARSR